MAKDQIVIGGVLLSVLGGILFVVGLYYYEDYWGNTHFIIEDIGYVGILLLIVGIVVSVYGYSLKNEAPRYGVYPPQPNQAPVYVPPSPIQQYYAPPQNQYCGYCGKQVPIDANNCPYCGKQIMR